MNAPLLVTAAVCVGAPTLLAAALIIRERIRPTDQRLDQLVDDEHGEHQIVDSEDHGHEPTDIEQRILDNLRGSAVPEQCVWRAACSTCGEAVYYQDCPTGGWWIHDRHPADSHEAVPRAETTERMRDRAIARHAAEFPANPVAGIWTFGVVPVTTAPVDVQATLAEISRTYDEADREASAATAAQMRRVHARAVVESRPPRPGEEEPALNVSDHTSPLTADQLDAEIANYEKAAADRFRHAGVTWPTNPATVGIARYDSKAGK